MTIDERLEFLLHSTESLHASCQELHATVRTQAEEFAAMRAATERRHRALMKGIEAFFSELDAGEDGLNGDKDGDS